MAAARSEKLGRLLGVASAVVHASDSIEVDWVTGASVLIRSEALREVGLFDDGFFLYFDEVELMHRLRARGWTVRHVPESRVFHLEGAATGLGAAEAQPYPEYWYQSRKRYFTLTGGRAGLLGANLGWLAGRLASVPKRLLGRRTASRAKIGKLLSSSPNSDPSFPRWGDPPGKPPSWMERR
jgi:GT2 family glycosyltransferase